MRTLDLIEYVVARPSGAAAQEIASALTIPLSSLSYLLATLVERDYLLRQGRRYIAGPGLDRLQRDSATLSLSERAGPLIQALGARLNETASLFEPVGWEMEVTATEISRQLLRFALDVGVRAPLHCIAAGKAFLATLPPEALEDYLDEAHRERFTPGTICDAKALRDEIERVREQGHACARDELSVGISAVARSVCVGSTTASVSVAVPSSRFTAEVEHAALDGLRETGRALEALAASPHRPLSKEQRS